MKKTSKIFYTNTYRQLELKIKDFLNDQADYLSPRTINSPRAVGDAIENILVENFASLLTGLLKEYSSTFARRSMADLAFSDMEDFYYVVDVKTHRLDTKFNMPNLTSVERLARLYEDDNNYFCILKINYTVNNLIVEIDKVTFVPIEFIAWDCLTIGALGWGQIQIANANTVKLTPNNTRKKWMVEMCNKMLSFYPKEILKIKDRINTFKQVKKSWESKSD